MFQLSGFQARQCALRFEKSLCCLHGGYSQTTGRPSDQEVFPEACNLTSTLHLVTSGADGKRDSMQRCPSFFVGSQAREVVLGSEPRDTQPRLHVLDWGLEVIHRPFWLS